MIGASYDDIRLEKSFFVVGKSLQRPVDTKKSIIKKSKMMRDTDAGK